MSVLILKNGDVRYHPMLDSHSDLVTYFKLPDDNAFIPWFAKAELTPHNWLDVSTWTWRLDEGQRPEWLTEEMERAAEKATRIVAGKMVLKDGAKSLIVDGCWILGGTVQVNDVRGGRIMRVQDSATVRDVRGSATVRDVRGSATVSHVLGSATVTDVGGSATVRDVWGSATQLDASAMAHLVKV